MSTVTKRQLAARFVDALGSQPLPTLAVGLVAAATEAGYGREDLNSLITLIEYELQARHGAVEVQLTTAHELSPDEQRDLATEVARGIGARRHSTTYRVDPALIGGFEAHAGDSAIRASVRSKLAELETTHA